MVVCRRFVMRIDRIVSWLVWWLDWVVRVMLWVKR